MKPKVAFIVQRYGAEVNGGAELYARWMAERLLPHADVTVLTTRAIDFYTWANHYPAGETIINGVRVQRYGVDKPRNWKRSQKQTRKVLLHAATLAEEEAWMKAQGPYSTALFDAIVQQQDDFDLFVFFTYIYATTYFGLPSVIEKSILVPAAHEEPTLAMGLFRPIFHSPPFIIYLTQQERHYVHARLENQHVPNLVAGIGINAPDQTDPDRFRQKFNISGDFLFYIGRIDPAKNVPALIDDFLAYQTTTGRDITLVLAGKSQIEIANHPCIRPIGFISEQDKFDGLRAATALVNPSLFESLSIVLLEAWLMGTPTLVNSRCSVLKNQSRRSNGGLWYGGSAEFTATLTYLLDHPAQRTLLGKNGQKFVKKEYDWNIVLAKFMAAFRFVQERLFSENSLS